MSLVKNERTLEVTVQKLIEAVNNHYDVDRVLADFGIRVLGVVNYTSDIPGYPNNRPTEAERHAFGDAYLVSVNSNGTYPYDTYIWTRVDPESDAAGIWLNIGQLNAVGPQGPIGPEGPQGETGQSTQWYAQSNQPYGYLNAGDMWLNTSNGNVYRLENRNWTYKANISGPQGIAGSDGLTPYVGNNGNWFIGSNDTGVVARGTDGENGLPGSALTIVGKLASIDLLPSPTEEERNNAYLVTLTGETRLYFIVGTESLSWDYIIFDGNGTVVTTNGVGVKTWETTNKLDKRTSSNIVYTNNSSGSPAEIKYNNEVQNYSIAYRDSTGNFKVDTPTDAKYCANKSYVDNETAKKLDKTTLASRTYVTDSQGINYTIKFTVGDDPYSMMSRDANGNSYVADPVQPGHIATKRYVDNLLEERGPYHTMVREWTKNNDAITLHYSDLRNIVPGTEVTIYLSQTGNFSSAPSFTYALGNQDISQQSNLQGIPYIYNSESKYALKVMANPDGGGGFTINKTDTDQVLFGDRITLGRYQEGAESTNKITVTWLAYT